MSDQIIADEIHRAVERLKKVNAVPDHLVFWGSSKELWFSLLHLPEYLEPDLDGIYRYKGIELIIVPQMGPGNYQVKKHPMEAINEKPFWAQRWKKR